MSAALFFNDLLDEQHAVTIVWNWHNASFPEYMVSRVFAPGVRSDEMKATVTSGDSRLTS
jgi:hypothetical protein